MAKDIVVLSDETGQEGGKAAAMNSNVQRLFNMMENRTSSASFWQKHSGNGADVKMRPWFCERARAPEEDLQIHNASLVHSPSNTRPLVRLEVQSKLLQSTWI